MKVFIDPGHGGSDPGAVGNDLREKDLTLDISLKEKVLFENLGHLVKMSRTTDITVSLETRTSEANQWGADIFISNHINAGGGEGEEVWCSITGGKGTEYATRIEKNLSEIFKSRGVKTKEGSDGDYFYVIRETNMPANLVEYAFIDNVNDAAKLKDPYILQKSAEAVVYGVLDLPFDYDLGNGSTDPEQPIVFTRYLSYKNPYMTGSDVQLVQTKLTESGFTLGTIDGIFGKNTENAVKAFQSSRKILVDGIVGPETWSYLMNSDMPSENKPIFERYLKYVVPNMKGNDVNSVQARLKELGFNPGTIDSIFGRNTENAVKSFQTSKKISVDGIVGPVTWDYLF